MYWGLLIADFLPASDGPCSWGQQRGPDLGGGLPGRAAGKGAPTGGSGTRCFSNLGASPAVHQEDSVDLCPRCPLTWGPWDAVSRVAQGSPLACVLGSPPPLAPGPPLSDTSRFPSWFLHDQLFHSFLKIRNSA